MCAATPCPHEAFSFPTKLYAPVANGVKGIQACYSQFARRTCEADRVSRAIAALARRGGVSCYCRVRSETKVLQPLERRMSLVPGKYGDKQSDDGDDQRQMFHQHGLSISWAKPALFAVTA